MPESTDQLHLLLNHLASHNYRLINGKFLDWKFQKILGGYNNIVYRVSRNSSTFAVKFTMRDERARAWREYSALTALQNMGLQVAPKPVLLDQLSYAHPVIVMTWLEGKVSKDPPQNEAEWTSLFKHYSTIHSVNETNCGIALPIAVLTIPEISYCKQFVISETQRTPEKEWAREHFELLRLFESLQIPCLPKVQPVLCRNDPNTTNYIRKENYYWLSVDWESSGLGDPAFEVANILTHPKFLLHAEIDQDWVIKRYASMTGDDQFIARVNIYLKTILAFWCFRWTRLVYEILNEMDKRLVDLRTDKNWREKLARKYQFYLKKAFEALS